MTPPATPPEPPDDQPKERGKPRPSRKPKPDPPAAAETTPALRPVYDAVNKPARFAPEGKRKRPPTREIDGKISAVVRDARNLNRLTQVELADAAGLSIFVYVRLEGGNVAWLTSQLVAVAKALKVQPTDLLVAAGLSVEPGGLPEQVIGRDRRLTAFQRELLIQHLNQLLAQNDNPGGV